MPFVLDVGKGLLSLRLSPLKQDMGKKPRPPSDKDPGESKAKQLKCDAGNERIWNSQQSEPQPSAKEVAAALAARARLYGGATESSAGVGYMQTCACPPLTIVNLCSTTEVVQMLMCTSIPITCSVGSSVQYIFPLMSFTWHSQGSESKLPDGPEPVAPPDIVYTPSEEILRCELTPAEVQARPTQQFSFD